MKTILNIKTILLAIFILISLKPTYSQSFDLGLAWSRDDYTTEASGIYNIVKQTDGTYLACGTIWQNSRWVGYIIHFNESGNKINDYILTPPASAPEWNTGTPSTYLKHAFLTTDGSIIAFGPVLNNGAATNLKGHDTNGTFTQLRNGLWVTKVNATDKTILLNRLDRNNSVLMDSYLIDADHFLLTGYDFDSTSSGKNSFIRVYDLNGDWTYDNYSTSNAKQTKIPWPDAIGDYSSTSLSIAGIDGVYEVSRADYSLVQSTPFVTGFVTNDGSNPQGCIPVMTNFGIPHPSYLQKKDGFWVGSRIGYTSEVGSPVKYWGFVMYEKDNTNTLQDCKVLYPSTVEYKNGKYSLPLLLPASTTNYVGTRVENGTNYIYICVDDPSGGFTINDFTTTYVYNTSLMTTSHTDGFFSAGSHNGIAAIAKYSTCVNFKVNNLPDNNRFDISSSSQMYVSIPLNYEGAKSADQSGITYSLTAKIIAGTVNGKTVGETLEDIQDQVVTSATVSEGYTSGRVLDLNRIYTMGSSNAIIEYTLSIRDSYTAGVPPVSQSCEQTYSFRIYSLGATDVVAMPVARLESGALKIKTSLKNIGMGGFSNPYKITIYKNSLGNATKYTYSHSQSIVSGQTVDLDLEIPNFGTDSQWTGTTTFVVSFNDAGDGTIDQMEERATSTFNYQISL